MTIRTCVESVKAKRIFSVVVVAALALVLGVALSPQKDDIPETQRTVLGINISNATIITDTDSHGGFHGDGITFLVVEFEDDSCLNQIKGNSSWKQLPVNYPVDALLYGTQSGSSFIGPYVTEGGKKLFPKAETGYYYFKDRHTGTGGQGNKDVVNRHSFNFTVALYDEDTQTLYYCEFDT